MSAFDTCRGISSVTIPNSVINIGNSAFGSCWNLTNLTIPNSVTTIGNHAFTQCTSLTTLTIPNSVTAIGLEAFSQCTSLTSVMIPDGVIYIEPWAFWNCYNLTSAYFFGNAPTTSTNFGDCVFDDTAPSFKIYYIQGKSGWTTPTWTSPARPFSHPYDVYNTATFVPFRVSGRAIAMNGKGKSGVIMTFSSSSSIAVPTNVTTDANGYWTQTGFVTGFTYRVVPPGGYKMYYPSYIEFSKSSTTLNFTQKLINPFPWLKF
jgi:hypothetical protein